MIRKQKNLSVLNRIDLILRGIGGRNAIASDKESQGKNKHDFATSCKSGRIRDLMAKNAKRSTAARWNVRRLIWKCSRTSPPAW